MIPDDHILSEKGMDASHGGRVLLLACGALAREILDIIKVNRWQHFDLQCLPAKLHLYPNQIPSAVAETVEKYRQNYDEIKVVYADCGTGGLLEAECRRLGVEMIEGPHCYSFFEGNEAFAHRAEDEFTAFYLTDFLVRQFDAFVWKPMGLDLHPELLPMYFGNYTKLVYQAQTDDAVLTDKAAGYAKQLGLEFERRYTGYGDLHTFIQKQAAQL